MTDPTPPVYNPPQYLITSSGLAAEQLSTLFESFKDSLRFATAAPELIFERVLADAFLTEPKQPEGGQNDGDLRQSLVQLQDKVKELQAKLSTVMDSTRSHSSNETHACLSSALPAVPIKFTFVRDSDIGLGVRVDRYKNGDGLYDMGCSWSNLGYSTHDSDIRYGSYNTIEDKTPLDVPYSASIQRIITFPIPFSSAPKVVLWLTGVDLRCDKLCKVRASLVWSDRYSFSVSIRVSENDILYSAGISWVVYTSVAEDYPHDRFNVPAYVSCDKVGTQYYRGHRCPLMGLLAIDEIVISGQIKWPLILHLEKATRDEIHWVLRASVEGPAFCLLGVRFMFVPKHESFEW